jgi:hypothetical protein
LASAGRGEHSKAGFLSGQEVNVVIRVARFFLAGFILEKRVFF